MKLVCLFAALGSMLALPAAAQQNRFPLGDGPWTYDTAEQDVRIRVSVVSDELTNPWSLAFLPNGDMLVTERIGQLRIFRNGTLDPTPIAGVPQVQLGGASGLMDIALHPQFASNNLIYLAYMKPAGPSDGGRGFNSATTLARARFDGGNALTDFREIFVAAPLSNGGGNGARILFLADGTLLVSASHRSDPVAPQDLNQHIGKMIRLNDDGSVPRDNPFVGRQDARPEIYTYGHRTVLGLTIHPVTGEVWESENGPLGGDEVNILRPGRNYGWPVVTYGIQYDGKRVSNQPWRDDMEPPALFWVPSITVTGITFYTGDKFPEWQGNLFAGSMIVGRVPGTGHLQRIAFNDNGEQRRETLLTDLKQRIRDVRQGPDGLLYLLTDGGAMLKIEPAE